MLAPAIAYKAEAEKFWLATTQDERYKWAHLSYNNAWTVPDNDWERLVYVSVVDGEVQGVLSARRDVLVGEAYLTVMSTGKHPYEFAVDLQKFLGIVSRMHQRIAVVCVVGNPAEKHYDKWVRKAGWRIIGVRRRACRLAWEGSAGELYDLKMYEWLKAQ